MPSRKKKKISAHRKTAPGADEIAVLQTLADLKPIVHDGELYSLQYMLTRNPKLIDKIALSMLATANIFHKLHMR